MVFKFVTVLALAAVATCSAAATSRIIGGSNARIEDFPAVVQVEFNTIFGWIHECGGTVLNSVYILSAAHCFSGSLYDPRDRRIRAGTADRESGGTVMEIRNAINHPDFDSQTLDCDITVVRLFSGLTLGNNIQQAAIIAPGFEFPANIPVTYVGWGRTSATNAQSFAQVLQQVSVRTVDRDTCAEAYQSLDSPRIITDNMLCAGVLGEGGRDACTGDAGGPVIFDNIVIGVISWGQGCGLPNFPGVNTNVASFTTWISETAV